MKDIVYIQKNIVLDAILLGINLIVLICIVPLIIIFNSHSILIFIAIALVVLMLAMLFFTIYFNRLGIFNKGIILKLLKRDKIISWQDILNIEIKVFHGKAIIIQYVIILMDKQIKINSNPNLIKILLKYCENNKNLKEILLQRRKEIEVELGF